MKYLNRVMNKLRVDEEDDEIYVHIYEENKRTRKETPTSIFHCPLTSSDRRQSILQTTKAGGLV